MVPTHSKIVDKNIKSGNLYVVNNKPCLVLEVTSHDSIFERRVLIRWAHEQQSYWIQYRILNDLVSDHEDR